MACAICKQERVFRQESNGWQGEIWGMWSLLAKAYPNYESIMGLVTASISNRPIMS